MPGSNFLIDLSSIHYPIRRGRERFDRLRKRKLIEKVFGWAKLDNILRHVKVRGVKKVNWLFPLLATAANLVRLMKLNPAV